MSVSGCPPSIGALRVGRQGPDWLAETLVKRLQKPEPLAPNSEAVKLVAQVVVWLHSNRGSNSGNHASRKTSTPKAP